MIPKRRHPSLLHCYAREVNEKEVANERELKFSSQLDRDPNESELAGALEAAGFVLGPATRIHNKDRYFDDARLSLSRAGLALRRRMSEGEVVATLKTRGQIVGALHDREEIELPMEGHAWPKPIRDRVETLTELGMIKTHTVIETERLRYAVLEGGRPVAILAFDSVTARTPQGERSVGFSEVEIEAHGPTEAGTLERIAQAVDRIVPLTANSSTKLERVRQLLMFGDW